MYDTDYSTTSEDFLRAGIELYNDLCYSDSLFYFEQLLEFEPDNTEALYYKGTQFESGLGVDQDEQRALECFISGAHLGHTACEYRTGLMYLEGRGATKDIQAAFDYIKMAAEKNYTLAQIKLSHFYQSGLVTHDCHVALSWLLKAAPSDDPHVFYLLGKIYYDGHDDFIKDIDQAKLWYEKAAGLNHPDAQLCMGYIYQNDQQDYFKALHWYEKASVHEKTSATAFFNIGLLYQCGHQDFTSNQETCFIYFLQAALNGHAQAQFNVALEYQNGQGVEKDYDQAYTWYTALEENKDNKIVQYNIGQLFKMGHGKFKQDLALSFFWFKLSADQNHKDAEKQVALMLQYGKGIHTDHQQALYWYFKNEECLSDPEIQFNIAKIYLDEKDISKAFEWTKKSADQGNPEAQIQLGEFYYLGQGVDKDFTEANEWYLKALEQNDLDHNTMLSLGKLYLHGYQSFEQDEHLALYYFQTSAELGNSAAALQVGCMYYEGVGVEKNYQLARQWFLKVSDDSSDAGIAYYNIAEMYYLGNLDKKDDQEAFCWYLEAAEKNHGEAQYMVGYMFSKGLGGALQNSSTAIDWFQKASLNGSNRARYTLATVYQSGQEGLEMNHKLALDLYREILKSEEHGDAYDQIGYMYENQLADLVQDYNKALEYYLKADKLNCSMAACHIGCLYLNGYGVARDCAKAFEWHVKSMEAGCPNGIYELAKMYFYGQHVQKDDKKAQELFQKALDKGMKANSVEPFLDQMRKGAMECKKENTEEPNNKQEIEKLKQRLTIMIREESHKKSMETQKRIEFLEEKLRQQNIEMERLLSINKTKTQMPNVIPSPKVEPFHLVLPQNNHVNNAQPIYSVDPKNEYHYRSTTPFAKVESNKTLDIFSDNQPVYAMSPALIDDKLNSLDNAISPLMKDDSTASTLSVFEELSLLSLDMTESSLNTKPDIKDNMNVYMHTNKPNEISEQIVYHKPNSEGSNNPRYQSFSAVTITHEEFRDRYVKPKSHSNDNYINRVAMNQNQYDRYLIDTVYRKPSDSSHPS